MPDYAHDREVIETALNTVKPDEIDDFAVTGWVVVVERMDPEGKLWLMRLEDEHSPKWKRDGLLHEALYGNWGGDDGE